ncbi:MAG TPA: DUF5671 domain-containing protein [Patescibacteria group bacterium]|nr:DUF5671 domain-containing protein [Patescibacteria group bacterium]
MDQIESSPTLVPRSGPKDVFLHLLALVTLYTSAVSFIALLFSLIDTWFPDPLDFAVSISNNIRWSASMLIVMFPVYLIVVWIINRECVQDPARREIRARKWLGYLTLFLSAVTFIVDAVVLVYQLLGGEVGIRFVLKVLVVLAVAAVIFFYYFYDLKKRPGATV